MKILIADDELHIRQGLEKLNWESIGIRLCGTAGTGPEALELAIKHNPDIILSDIKMPGESGLEMTEKFIRINPMCVIIFLSGHREFTYAKKALEMGAFDYLLKPTSPEEILECCLRAKARIQERAKQSTAFVEMKYKIKELEIRSEIKEDDNENINKSKVQEILGYIDENYSKDLSLQLLATEFHFNPIYINRIIKKETGYTFLEILNNKRMNKAVQLLKIPDIKIWEVAELIGIPDQRYFSQIFKKYYGQSPKQYKKMI